MKYTVFSFVALWQSCVSASETDADVGVT